VQVQNAGQTADHTSLPDPPRKLSLEVPPAVKRHLDVIGRSRGGQAHGPPDLAHRTRTSRARTGARALRAGTEQPALRLKEISGQGTQKRKDRVRNQYLAQHDLRV